MGYLRHPPWLRVKIPSGGEYKRVRAVVQKFGLHTICEEGRCPNVARCWGTGTATFLILGDVCTRRCAYCAVKTGIPTQPDLREPRAVAQAVKELDLRYVVITSVTRDDLADGGAGMFAQTVAWIRRLTSCQVEVLVPDFGGAEESVRTVIGARPDVFAHNLEVVERLFAQIRPQGDYRVSLRVLQMAKQMADIPTKSGLMIGLGESRSEIVQTMEDLRAVRCDFLAIGQYLQPTRAHHPVVKYWRPSQFDEFKQIAEELGFAHVESAPLVRSSYGAEKLLGKLS